MRSASGSAPWSSFPGSWQRARPPGDAGLQLLESATATAFGFAAIILLVGPVSGAYLNPVISVADWWLGRRAGEGLSGRAQVAYLPAQIAGAAGGARLANLMFDLTALDWASTDRDRTHLRLGELVATADLVLLVFALAGPSGGGRSGSRG